MPMGPRGGPGKRRAGPASGGRDGDGVQVEKTGWLGEIERPQDRPLARRRLGALLAGAGRSGEGAQVHPLELVTQAAPGLAGLRLGDADQQKPQPAQDHMGADALLEAVMDWA